MAPAHAARTPRLHALALGILVLGGAAGTRAEMRTVSGVRELADGRAIVLDARERKLFLFDWTEGYTTRISREGRGAREYSRPDRLIALSGDSTLVDDPGNDRYLVLGPSGQPIGTLPALELRATRGAGHDVSVRGADLMGRFYFALPEPLVRDRSRGTPIVRLDRETQRTDTMAVVWEGDEWVVLPEGGIAIVRAVPFRVEWHPSYGAPAIGPEVPRERARSLDGEPATLLAPDGQLWVARPERSGAGMVIYDVFDRTGERSGRMSFDSGSRVVGFGRERVYVVRRDADGEVFLDRFPIGR